MSYRQRQTVGLVTVLIVIVALLTGSVIGGAVGYLAASSWDNDPQAVQAVGVPVSQTDRASVTQELVLTEESASVGAVEQVMPAVVTVLVQSGLGPGSGSGVFISEEGYVVM